MSTLLDSPELCLHFLLFLWYLSSSSEIQAVAFLWWRHWKPAKAKIQKEDISREFEAAVIDDGLLKHALLTTGRRTLGFLWVISHWGSFSAVGGKPHLALYRQTMPEGRDPGLNQCHHTTLLYNPGQWSWRGSERSRVEIDTFGELANAPMIICARCRPS